MTVKRHWMPLAGHVSRASIAEPPIARLLFAETTLAPLWLLVRLYVGASWLGAGWAKLADPAGTWVGARAGAGIVQQLAPVLEQPATGGAAGATWYIEALAQAIVAHAALAGQVLLVAEILLGVATIVGLFTGVAAFLGSAIHTPYVLLGNPLLVVLALLLALAWRVAGYYGLDRWVLPLAGVPGYSSALVHAPRRETDIDDLPVRL